MKLELGTIQIKQFTFAEKTSLAGGHLQLCQRELEEFIRTIHPQIVEVETVIVHPGEEVRIMPVKDVIEPRTKLDDGCCFPCINRGKKLLSGAVRHWPLKAFRY